MNHWPRCTTLRQMRNHFVGHPERRATLENTHACTYYDEETGNRCAPGMIVTEDIAKLLAQVNDGIGWDDDGGWNVSDPDQWLAFSECPWTPFQVRLVQTWHDHHDCKLSQWPVELASDEILDREWA